MIHVCDHKLLIFNLLLIMSVLACETNKILTFTAYERGKVEIQCPYKSEYKTHNKYLCRGVCRVLDKYIIVESGSTARDRRFSLTDNRTTHIFTFTITDLRTDDKGQYWCAVRTTLGKFDQYTEINLEIKNVSNVSAVTGEHLNISCHYESDMNNHVKFICKGGDPSFCEKSAIKVSSETNSNGRFSLRDDESARVFTVTITDLAQEDSGIYWCGAVERGNEHKNKWISAIDLKVSNYHRALNQVTSESPKPTTTASDHSSKPATADTASDRPATSVFPSSSSITSSSVSSSNNAVPSKPELGFTMIIGILTGFGFSLFMYFRCRRKKEGNQPRDVVQGPTEHPSDRHNEPNREVSDYEDISNTLDHPVYSSVLPVFDEHDDSVYALAQLPSSPSDNLTYSTVRFLAAHHSDRTSETCVYTTVRP